jgi:diadenosine tetraphosphate (Ap4A) HIT family hydrolase
MPSACPFCSPADDDHIVFETRSSRVLCDARPIVPGHLLVAPKAHVASAMDLPPLAYADLRAASQEACWRVRCSFGEVGVYEHGRSAVCRFHANDQRHFHAHLHVLPISFDLLSACPPGQRLQSPPSILHTPDTRYVYQECDTPPREAWGTFDRVVPPRHLVRLEAERSLRSRGRRFLPLDLPAWEHEEAVDRTLAAVWDPAASTGVSGILLAFSPEEIHPVATFLGKHLGWPVVTLAGTVKAVERAALSGSSPALDQEGAEPLVFQPLIAVGLAADPWRFSLVAAPSTELADASACATWTRTDSPWRWLRLALQAFPVADAARLVLQSLDLRTGERHASQTTGK